MEIASVHGSVWAPWGQGRRGGFLYHIAPDRRMAQFRASAQECGYIDTTPILEYEQSASGIDINRLPAPDMNAVHFVVGNV